MEAATAQDNLAPSPAKANGAGFIVKGLDAWYGAKHAVKSASMTIEPRTVTAIIGPSGCGKSTFLRCLNRLHETIPGARVSGHVLLDGQDIYAPSQDPVQLRRRVGMVFQKPNPFPAMTIRENVLAGLTFRGDRPADPAGIVETALRGAALWDEVKGLLDQPGRSLSGGQQQRLCIARAIAIEPEVLLMDEPCSALDPIATERVESLIAELHLRYTVVIVTHNMQQARRVSTRTAFFLNGDLVEVSPTEQLFAEATDPRTRDYVAGRFG